VVQAMPNAEQGVASENRLPNLAPERSFVAAKPRQMAFYLTNILVMTLTLRYAPGPQAECGVPNRAAQSRFSTTFSLFSEFLAS